jgi:5-methylcytosine-specific restriction protein A
VRARNAHSPGQGGPAGLPLPPQTVYAEYVVDLVSTSRTMLGGVADRATLPKGTNGRVLCRWCGLEVPTRRFTFCSDWCVHEWRLRCDPGYLRAKVLQRDRGVCAICQIDTCAAYGELRRSRGTHRLRLLAKWRLKRLTRKTLWDADHILPVVEGGGECDLQNLRTLCLLCHRQQTLELRRRLRASSLVVS